MTVGYFHVMYSVMLLYMLVIYFVVSMTLYNCSQCLLVFFASLLIHSMKTVHGCVCTCMREHNTCITLHCKER